MIKLRLFETIFVPPSLGIGILLVGSIYGFFISFLFHPSLFFLFGALLALPILYMGGYFYLRLNKNYDLTDVFFKDGFVIKRISQMEHIKKIIILLIPFLLFFVIISYIPISFITYITFNIILEYNLIFKIQVILLYTVIFGLLNMTPLIFIKDFYYRAAKTFVISATKNDNKLKRLNLFIFGLNFYNRFLQRSLKLQIKDIAKVYSFIIFNPLIYNTDILQIISNSFESDDNVEPIRCIKKVLGNSEELLIQQQLGQKIKDYSSIIIPIITIIITVIGFFIKK
jgi:hypothetical protein